MDQRRALGMTDGTINREAGMLSGEMPGLEWRWVELKARPIYLEAVHHHQKNGKFGSVPLNKEAMPAALSMARFRAEHCPGSGWVFCDGRGRWIPEGEYLATSDEVPGLVAQGRTITETLEIARDVAKKLLEAQAERHGEAKLTAAGDSFDYPLIVGS